jgi:hypothetical protein
VGLLLGYEYLLSYHLDDGEKMFRGLATMYFPGWLAGQAQLGIQVAAAMRRHAARLAPDPAAGQRPPVGSHASPEIQRLYGAVAPTAPPDGEKEFQENLEKARQFDRLWPGPPRTRDDDKAIQFYLAAIAAKPAARDDPALGLAATRRRCHDPAPCPSLQSPAEQEPLPRAYALARLP